MLTQDYSFQSRVFAFFQVFAYQIVMNTKSSIYQNFLIFDLLIHKLHIFLVLKLSHLTISNIMECLFYYKFKMQVGNLQLELLKKIFIKDSKPYLKLQKRDLFRQDMKLNIFCFPKQLALSFTWFFASLFEVQPV